MNKNNTNSILIYCLLFIGLFSPTSINGIIITELYFLQCALLGFMLLILFLNSAKRIGIIFIVMLINLILWLFTLVNLISETLTKYAFGGYIPYILLSLLFLINFKNISVSPKITVVFNLLSIVMLILSAFIIANNTHIKQFFANYYSWAYDNLVVNMLAKNKPVLFFGSHSVASLFFYLFFYLNFETYLCKRKLINLIFAICFTVLLIFLNSVSSYLFLLIVAIQLFLKIKIAKIAIPALLILGILFNIELLTNISNNIFNAFSSSTNGFIGRYSEKGILMSSLSYIADNPFLPIGLCYSNDLYFTDSGIILNLLRGSAILVFLIYSGLFLFLKYNMNTKKSSFWLFFVFMLFEIGYPNLLYIRTLYFMPFIVTYLNYISRNNNTYAE